MAPAPVSRPVSSAPTKTKAPTKMPTKTIPVNALPMPGVVHSTKAACTEFFGLVETVDWQRPMLSIRGLAALLGCSPAVAQKALRMVGGTPRS